MTTGSKRRKISITTAVTTDMYDGTGVDPVWLVGLDGERRNDALVPLGGART